MTAVASAARRALRRWAHDIIRVPVNDLVLMVLGALPFPRSKRAIQAALWLVWASGDWLPNIAELKAHA